MTQSFHAWLEDLQAKRQRWVNASEENDFNRGIWNATVEKYADPSHFIFELLQNAEDTGATRVKFTLEADRITFEHDGRPFDREDIEGITGIGNTTKLNQGHKIGCFGIGFKSVYIVTERPEVHSRIEGANLAFVIDDLVVPQLVSTDHTDPTTKIVLPLRPDRAETTLQQARDVLAASGPNALLFLEHVTYLEWQDGRARGRAEAENFAGGIRAISSILPDGTSHRSRYLILSRDVEHSAEHKQYGVKVALRMNGDGDLVPEETATRLRVFFETEELTGLRFAIHGPFQLTDNRANMKREDVWNETLIETIGSLIADALPDLRERGLLKRSVLDLLPNANDDLPAAFAPILDRIVAKFGDEPLIPAHGGGFTTSKAAIRGPSDLRDLLGEDGIDQFGGKPNRRWVSSGFRNPRTDAFFSTLSVSEWTFADFLSSFQRAFSTHYTYSDSERQARAAALAWFMALSDERTQLFYLALDSSLKAHRNSVSLANLQFVKLEDGRRHSPTHAVLAPADSELDAEAQGSELFLVKRSLVRSGRGRGKDIEQFLRRAGVRDVDEKAYLVSILLTHYADGGARPNRERHLQHMRRFLRWWKEHGDVSLFAGRSFVRGGPDADYHSASEVYVGAPFLQSGLSKIYDGSISGRDRVALWDGYDKLRTKDLLEFLGKCGVESELQIERGKVYSYHPHFAQLYEGFGSARHTSTATDDDYKIDQISALLKRSDPDISRLIWDAARRGGASVMTARYSPNQTHAANQAPSSLAVALRNAAWLPAKDGSLRQPRTMVAADLAAGFPIGGNEAWLQAIGFGELQKQQSEQRKAVRKAGELIGLSAELVDQLQDQSPEVLAAVSADVMRKIASGAYSQPAFPTRESGDPARRAERVAARASSAPAKTFEMKQRSVRVSDMESKALARPYLQDHYTNDLGEMVCQACHNRMPFNLLDGSPYFEAPELLDGMTTEHAENRLALCPTCAAKWQHANGTSNEDLRLLLGTAAIPEISVSLAGEIVRLRFTQMHLDDVRTVGAIQLQVEHT
jgi:hypothetical protein